MKKLKKLLRLLLLVILLIPAAFGLGLMVFHNHRYHDKEIRTELVEKKEDEAEEE
jgi:hypothetical protein